MEIFQVIGNIFVVRLAYCFKMGLSLIDQSITAIFSLNNCPTSNLLWSENSKKSMRSRSRKYCECRSNSKPNSCNIEIVFIYLQTIGHCLAETALFPPCWNKFVFQRFHSSNASKVLVAVADFFLFKIVAEIHSPRISNYNRHNFFSMSAFFDALYSDQHMVGELSLRLGGQVLQPYFIHCHISMQKSRLITFAQHSTA